MRWSDAFTTPAPALSRSASIGLAVDSVGFLSSALGKFFGRDSFLAALAVLFSTWLGNALTLPPANWVASAGTELFSKIAPWRNQLHQTIQVNWLCRATGTEKKSTIIKSIGLFEDWIFCEILLIRIMILLRSFLLHILALNPSANLESLLLQKDKRIRLNLL